MIVGLYVQPHIHRHAHTQVYTHAYKYTQANTHAYGHVPIDALTNVLKCINRYSVDVCVAYMNFVIGVHERCIMHVCRTVITRAWV